MSTFGEVVIAILVTIIASVVDTTAKLSGYMLMLFRIIAVNSGRAQPLVLFTALMTF